MCGVRVGEFVLARTGMFLLKPLVILSQIVQRTRQDATILPPVLEFPHGTLSSLYSYLYCVRRKMESSLTESPPGFAFSRNWHEPSRMPHMPVPVHPNAEIL